MRFVDRSQFPVPPTLGAVPSTEIERVKNGGVPRGQYYAAPDVKNTINSMYRTKCAFCEVKLGSHGEYEHFHPWKGNEPEKRAYSWQNINVTCKLCNHRKRRKEYKRTVNGLTWTALMDPSLPLDESRSYPFHFLDQDPTHPVLVAHQYAGDVNATNTASFLADSMVYRILRYNAFVESMLAPEISECIAVWQELAALPQIVIPTDESRARYLRALSEAANIYVKFLSPEAEFSVAMAQKLLSIKYLRLSVRDFERMKEKWVHACTGLESGGVTNPSVDDNA